MDQIRGCDQLRHAISLYRPCVSPLPSWRRNKKGEEEREREREIRGETTPPLTVIRAITRVSRTRVRARNILLVPKWLFSRRETCPSRLEEKTGETKLDEEGNEGGDSREIPLATLTIVPSPLGGEDREGMEREGEKGEKREMAAVELP